MKSRIAWLTACLVQGALITGTSQAGTQTFHLEIGDPARKGVERPLVIDGITDARTGEALSPKQLAGQLSNHRVVFVGESHTDMEFHRAQLRLIEELVLAGRWVLLGLEMYPYTEQEHLDRWITGLYSEEGFLDLSSWYENWGYHWQYYRDIFLYARDNRIPMFALNTPRDVIAAVRKKGFEDLSDEEAEQVPAEIDFDSDEHRLLFRTLFDDEDGGFHMALSDEMLDSFFQAQCAWDATFAHNSLKALRPYVDDPNVVMVVLVGSGHLLYDLGIQRQMAQWTDLPVASVIPVPVADRDGERVERVRASFADFLWGLPQSADPLFPSLGVSTRAETDGTSRAVIDVQKDSVAEAAGFSVGDVLLAIDGRSVPDRQALNKAMSEMRWGDTAVVTVRRGEQQVDLEVAFRRSEAEDEGVDNAGAEPEQAERADETGD